MPASLLVGLPTTRACHPTGPRTAATLTSRHAVASLSSVQMPGQVTVLEAAGRTVISLGDGGNNPDSSLSTPQSGQANKNGFATGIRSTLIGSYVVCLCDLCVSAPKLPWTPHVRGCKGKRKHSKRHSLSFHCQLLSRCFSASNALLRALAFSTSAHAVGCMAGTSGATGTQCKERSGISG